jgi:hypothetical protein
LKGRGKVGFVRGRGRKVKSQSENGVVLFSGDLRKKMKRMGVSYLRDNFCVAQGVLGSF